MCTINKLNNEANGDNNTAIVLYRGGNRKGKWWSESKEFADCFGADNGKETIMQEFTFRNVLDISFRSSIDYLTVAELGEIAEIPAKEILKELLESRNESTLVNNENDKEYPYTLEVIIRDETRRNDTFEIIWNDDVPDNNEDVEEILIDEYFEKINFDKATQS